MSIAKLLYDAELKTDAWALKTKQVNFPDSKEWKLPRTRKRHKMFICGNCGENFERVVLNDCFPTIKRVCDNCKMAKYMEKHPKAN